jgi:hypothetical protein
MRTAPFLLVCLLATVAAAPADPDWPCVQRLVPTLTAATLWAGPAPKGDWHADKEVAALVEQVADRRRPVEDGVAKLEQFVAAKPGAEARAEVFAGLIDRSNAERSEAIARLRSIARRLRALAGATGRVTTELNALPPDAPAVQRDEVVNRRALMIREYEELGRTVRYACEIPVEFEARLGRFAQVLQSP